MTGDWETSGARIVISSEALDLPCRPINEGCVKAEIRSTKALFPCPCLCDTDLSVIKTLGSAFDDDTGKGYPPKSLKAGGD